ncbi:hypothetical protein [uncultured Ruegeria sp.]|uniref:hypothetical protein n=1 Tax=uncultured Ruegeria sp. TaxID=259304 RepID=UPI00260FD2CD|nr:hypothetical protein [uncultured Ruegeria sp.]
MTETDRPGFWRLGNPILWACIATVGFAGLITWFGLAPTCSGDFFPKGECPPKWRHLYAAPPNEVGDTLAGLAGVLAFIWLIATVLLQSVELGEQRRVLALQKEEMKEQREATQEMARSLSAQAKIFEGEARQREEDRVEALFNENLRSLIVEINEASAKGLGWHFSNDVFFDDLNSNGEVHSYYLGDQRNADKTIDEAIIDLRRRLRGTYPHLWELLHTSVDYKLPGRTNLVADLIPKIEFLLAMEKALSPPQRERLSRMRLHEIKFELRKLVDTSEFWAEADS